MSGVSDPRVLRFWALFIISAVVLFALMGCMRADEPTPTPTSEPTAAPAPSTPTSISGSTPPPATATQVPPTPTPTPVPLPECEVGMRLDPGDGCTFANDVGSFFELVIEENGDSVLDGIINRREIIKRVTGPEEKLCVCDLETESDGLARTILTLPQLPPIHSGENPPPLREPYHQECQNGLVVRQGEICRFPETYCYFDVTTDGLGRFATLSDMEHIEVRDIDLGDKTISFTVTSSGGRWRIEHLSRVIVERGVEDPSECIADPLVVGLAESARIGDADSVRWLISQGVDVNGRNEVGNSALWYAAISREDIVMTSILLGAGADLTMRDWNGDHVLTGVFWDQNLEMVKLLVEAGADVNGIDGDGSPPLRTAIHVENMELLQYLVDSGADVNQQAFGGSLLASALDSVEITRLLIDAGADVNARDGRGNAVLADAVRRGTAEVLKLLLDAGAHPDGDSENGTPALWFAVESGSIEKARLLLDAGANPNSCGADGSFALRQAIESRSLEMVALLVEADADVNDFVSGGQTLLEFARAGSTDEIVQYLIEAGAE